MSEQERSTGRQTLAALVAQRRRELSERLDISPRLRQLSRSALPPAHLAIWWRRSPAVTAVVAATAVALLAACLLGGAGIVAGGYSLQGKLSDPATTAQNFYAALHEQDYAHAYAQLSPTAQQHSPQAAFTAQYTDLDAVAGVVDSYSITSASANGATATVIAGVVRRNDSTRAQTQLLTLVQVSGVWQIDRIAFGGSGPAPGQANQ